MHWLRLETEPPLEFFREAAVRPFLSADMAYRRLLGIGDLVRPVAVLGRAETANVSVSLDDADGKLYALFEQIGGPPLAARARIMTPDGDIFSGTVVSYDAADTITLSIEAGGAWPLSDPIPLRTTASLGAQFAEIKALPWAFGRVTVEPIQIDRRGVEFVLADHAIQALDAVRRDDAPYGGVEWTHRVDITTGLPFAVLRLADPLLNGERLAADIRGYIHPETGELVTNPADIIWLFLSRLCGFPVRAGQLAPFRAEAAALGIELHGVINDHTRQISVQIDEIAASAGAIWSGALPGIAQIYPQARGDAPLWATFDRLTAPSIQSRAVRADVYNAVVVEFDHDHAGQPRGTVEYDAPSSVQRFGVRRLLTISAYWIKDMRVAVGLVERLLPYFARARLQVTFQVGLQYADIPPGGWVGFVHPHAPAAAFVTSPTLSLQSGRVSLAAEAPVGAVPSITLVRTASRYAPVLAAAADVQIQNGYAEFTFRDDAGQPLANARVTLDGSVTRTTTAAGWVQFQPGPGSHTLLIEATGREPQTLTFEMPF